MLKSAGTHRYGFDMLALETHSLASARCQTGPPRTSLQAVVVRPCVRNLQGSRLALTFFDLDIINVIKPLVQIPRLSALATRGSPSRPTYLGSLVRWYVFS